MSIDDIFRAEQGPILASLIRSIGDWQVAEDAVMEAFTAALERWPRDGLPERPGAWLAATAQRKAIDLLRRQQTRNRKADGVREHIELTIGERVAAEEQPGGDQLSLVFTCCHPVLAPEARIALTLRYVAGLSTRQVARAFQITESTMAKRLVRAKARLGGAGVPYQVPDRAEMGARLGGVLRVLYLLFSEGYAATEGGDLMQLDLCHEALRLCALLRQLLDHEPEIDALLALMLFTHARRTQRLDADGELVLLADQDRAAWDRQAIEQGRAALGRALRLGQPGPFLLQACIAELQVAPERAEETDWAQIAQLYERLHQLTANPVVRLNQAVAVALSEGPEAGLVMLDPALGRALARNHLFPAARADLLRRAGRWQEAAVAYRQALERVRTEPERRFLERRLRDISS